MLFLKSIFALCFLQVFRKDLISAMKLPDSHHVNPDEYYVFADTWKQEWEKGVQVPASPETIPQPSLRYWWSDVDHVHKMATQKRWFLKPKLSKCSQIFSVGMFKSSV